VIKLLKHDCDADFQIDLWFSDNSLGRWNALPYLKTHQGPLLEPLREASYFRRCFIDAGALCWPNGLELSAARLHELATARETV
jgi:hypothetical protein